MGQAKSKSKNKKINEVQQKFKSKEEYFIKNGGILWEKQMALSQGQDIGTFDDRIVAIKTAQEALPNPKLVDRFLTDASIRMVTCHSEMVMIYGCCLQTCVPMIVYEFYPNKDLLTRLKLLKWRDRLRVAADIAYALSYMHNALSKPLVYRDVMTFRVLLDSSFHVKLSDFGYSVAITPGNKEQKWPVQGTPGYIDPEYIETREVTKKCDVYSFGVLMLELITARDPVKMTKCGKDLVDEFASTVERNGGMEMIDNIVTEEGDMDEIRLFTTLALTCVAKKGEERPNMISVVEDLWRIHDHGNLSCGR
ncbi:hypothetical protein RND81_07G052100 [Saponaria officinalis]|uniref:Protein kinase domain-containing protein n=1 Tax=Saponaria officinalis TaxID=3572 RepID=A0AAW1JND3_SAPOF